VARLELPFGRIVVQPRTGDTRRFVVVQGDSLWNIARAHYGDGMRHTVIFGANKDLIKSLGADEVIDYQKTQFEAEALRLTGGVGVDAAYDTVGGDTVSRSICEGQSYSPRSLCSWSMLWSWSCCRAV